MTGMLAMSLAGHDKGTLYYILKSDGESVDLVDGRIRTIEHPKHKKCKHIQLIKERQEELIALNESGKLRNEDIKRVLKARQKRPV